MSIIMAGGDMGCVKYFGELKGGAENFWSLLEGVKKPFRVILPQICMSWCSVWLQIGVRRTKLNTLITFPVRGLDMSQHASRHNHVTRHNTAWSPWRRNKNQEAGPEDYVYDLYAVCNHYGNMQGGHYTGNSNRLSGIPNFNWRRLCAREI